MTTYSRSPKLMKGAIVGLDPMNPLASVIIFQYNPHTLTRELTPKSGQATSNKKEPFKLSGAAEESITVDMEIDAADQMETGDGIAEEMGIYPQLSALEMLLYPKSAFVIANTIMAALGTLEVFPPDPPMTLFIWGYKRIVPVKMTSYTITETYHDSNLNPIQATANVKMKVLTYSDLSMAHPGYYVSLANQITKEVMATIGSVSSIKNLF